MQYDNDNLHDDPMDALYEHLDTIDAEQSGAPMIHALHNFVLFLHTIPAFLSMNPSFRSAVTEACLSLADQTDIGTSARELLSFIGSLRNRDDYVA
jgi:hypothetical protein